MHGEDFTLNCLQTYLRETPPYARGRQALSSRPAAEPGNTPVCTGKTYYEHTGNCLNWKHPRMHGEDRPQCGREI